jgi:hypothetical protein
MKLDNDFIKRATKVTSFNLNVTDFQSLKNKAEIQHLYKQHMFGSFEPEQSLSTLNKNKFNALVNILKKDDLDQYTKLHNLTFKSGGVGPGEAVLYLLTKTGRLGGGSSAGVDLIISNKKYEVKAAKWKSKSTKDTVSDFRLGGNIEGMAQFESKLLKQMFENKIISSPGVAEVKELLFKQFKEKNKTVYNKLEKEYQKLAGSYFASHEVVFIQNDENSSDFGEIISIQKVEPKDILMERYTSRSLKPLVKIK